MLQIYESTIHTVFLSCVVPSFNLKPDDCNLATTILVYKLSQLHKTLILEGFGWYFSDWTRVNVL